MNALVQIETLTPEKVFAPGGVEEIITKLERDVRALPAFDISTEEGRDEIKALAYKIARSKTGLDELGKNFVAELKKQSGAIDADRRIIRERLDALKDEVRRPVTEWETSEQARVDGHENALTQIRAAAELGLESSSALIQERLKSIRDIAQRDWQEYEPRALAALAVAEDTLRAALAVAQKREADAAELEQLRAAQATRERQENEERARIQAEENRKAAEKREQDRAAQAERDKQAAAQRAADEAVAAERQRVADEEAAKARQKEADEAAERKRQANKRHREKIHREITAALSDALFGKDVAIDDFQSQILSLVVAAIRDDAIPHLTINY